MAVTSGFYNSFEGDRKYDAIQMGRLFDGAFMDGVFQTIGDKFAVTPSSEMTVLVGTGRAWFNHTWTLNDAPFPVDIPQAEVILNRIDTIVIDVDGRNEVRLNTIKVIKGTPASSPVAPTLIKSLDRNQYPLANVAVAAGVLTITAANITNRVGTPDCPYVKGVIVPGGDEYLPLLGGTVSGPIYIQETGDASSYEFWNKKNLPNPSGPKTVIFFLTGSTTWTVPAQYKDKEVDVWMIAGGGGGGGGGGGAGNNSTFISQGMSGDSGSGGGGGGGGECKFLQKVKLSQTSYPIVIGAGGTGGAAGTAGTNGNQGVMGSDGTDGGNTSAFGVMITGGKKGTAGYSGRAPGSLNAFGGGSGGNGTNGGGSGGVGGFGFYKQSTGTGYIQYEGGIGGLGGNGGIIMAPGSPGFGPNSSIPSKKYASDSGWYTGYNVYNQININPTGQPNPLTSLVCATGGGGGSGGSCSPDGYYTMYGGKSDSGGSGGGGGGGYLSATTVMPSGYGAPARPYSGGGGGGGGGGAGTSLATTTGGAGGKGGDGASGCVVIYI